MKKSYILVKSHINSPRLLAGNRIKVYMDSIKNEIIIGKPVNIPSGYHIFFLLGSGHCPLFVNVKEGETIMLQISHVFNLPQFKRFNNIINNLFMPIFCLEISEESEK